MSTVSDGRGGGEGYTMPNEVLYISADVRKPKKVNLKVISPRVKTHFLFCFFVYIFLTALSTNPTDRENSFKHFVPFIFPFLLSFVTLFASLDLFRIQSDQ